MTDWFGDDSTPRTGSFRVVVKDLATSAEAWALLRANTGTGWICTTDRARRVPCDDLPEMPLLSAEIVLSKDRSLHVRQHGAGWRAWFLEDGIGDGPDLAVTERFESTEGTDRLVYRTWWRLAQEGELNIWRPSASRLLGWEEGR